MSRRLRESAELQLALSQFELDSSIEFNKQNERIYNIDNWLIEDLQNRVREHLMIGELVHEREREPLILLSNVSHSITNIEEKDDKLIGTINILETPKGKILKSLLKEGTKLSISPRMTGVIDREGKVHVKDIHSFDLTIDANSPIIFNRDDFFNRRYKFKK